MNNATHSHPHIKYLGHFIFAVLALFSLYFWQERTLILDAAFQSYLFISTGFPAIMVERFGAGATHLLPLIGVYLGLSLKSVLILYSFSIVLFHYILFVICEKILKNPILALSIALFNVFLIGDGFFWMQNELLQAISLMFVMWAFFIKKQAFSNFRWWDYALGVGLVVTVVYYHPLIIFPLAFIWLFLFLFKKNMLTQPMLLTLAGLFALTFLSKYFFRQPNFYDRGMTGQYVREFHFSISTLLNSNGFALFKTHLFDNFAFLIPVYLWVTLFYIKNKNYTRAILVNAFCGFYFVLIANRYLDDSRWYTAECHYQPLAVFLLIPFIWDILPTLTNKRWTIVGLSVFCCIRLFTIFQTHKPYTDRLNYITQLVDSPAFTAHKKIIIEESETDKTKLMMTWGMPYESLQISSLKSPDSTKIVVIAENGLEKEKELSNSKDSMVTFLMLPKFAFKDLPKKYYNVIDIDSISRDGRDGYRFIGKK